MIMNDPQVAARNPRPSAHGMTKMTASSGRSRTRSRDLEIEVPSVENGELVLSHRARFLDVNPFPSGPRSHRSGDRRPTADAKTRLSTGMAMLVRRREAGPRSITATDFRSCRCSGGGWRTGRGCISAVRSGRMFVPSCSSARLSPCLSEHVSKLPTSGSGSSRDGKFCRGLTADLAESSTTQGRYAGPTAGTERVLAEVLAEILHVERVI